MPSDRVLIDACVLFRKTLRDWLLIARDESEGSIFQVVYTEDILAETIRSIRRRRPELSGTEITRIRDTIGRNCDDQIDEYPSGLARLTG